MKLRVNRQEMADTLSAICTVAATRTTKPILQCVRVEAQADVLLLSATDLELALRCSVTQVEVDEPGEALVIADTLTRIVREVCRIARAFGAPQQVEWTLDRGTLYVLQARPITGFPSVSRP